MIVNAQTIFDFHKEVAVYYFKSISEVFTLGITERESIIAKSSLVGFWKIKKFKK